MVPSSCIDISHADRGQLLEVARQSIETGLVAGKARSLDRSNLDGVLAAPLGVFVTLTQRDVLRGCMGSLESSDALAQTTAVCAFNAAFRDPRFPQLNENEVANTRIEISVLSDMEPVKISDRNNLLQQMQSGNDGWLMQDGGFRATFLPGVWEKIGSAEEFFEHLLAKAGLPRDHWSSTIRFFRYYTVSFTEQ